MKSQTRTPRAKRSAGWHWPGASLIAVAVLSVSAVAAEPTPGDPLDLRAAVARALAHHPLGDAAAADRAAAQAAERESTARLLPQVGLRESWARSDDPVFAFSSLLEQGRFTVQDFDPARLNDPAALDHFRTRIAVEEPIFALPAWYGRSAAGSTLDAATAAQDAVREALTLQVVESYLGLTVARDAVAVAEEAERAADADLRRARSLVDAGTALEADALQAEVHRKSVAQSLEGARGDARVAELALASLIGAGDAVGPLAAAPPWLEAEAGQPAAAGAVDDGLARRADLVALRHQRDAALAGVSGARAALLPSLGLVASEQWDREKFASDGEPSYAVGVALDWNLLAGGADFAKIEGAEAARAAASARLEARERDARLEIGTREATLATARARLAAALGAADLAAEAKRVVERRYEQGLTTWSELVSVESAWSDARLRELGARYGVWLAWARREHALGRLGEAFAREGRGAGDTPAGVRREEP